mgnify:CR=1 FL=1
MVHHNFRKGQKVLIILQNGQQIIDKYFGSKGRYLLLENYSIEWKDIRSSTIYKNKGNFQK